LTAELIGWQDEDSLDHRRRMRNAMLVSLAIHGLFVAVVAATPGSQLAPLPAVLAVELVAALPSPAPRAKPAPAPPKAAEPAPAPPTPEPPPEPAPPVAKAPVQVLPEEAPGRIRKVKPEPKPAPKPVVRRPVREKQPSLEDVMAELADELGVDETADLLKPAVRPSENEDSNAQAPVDDRRARPGAAISPELAAWNRKTLRLIQSKWVTPSSYRGQGLATSLELNLAASGALIGKPVVRRSSGDPFFDDNAVRALLTVAPLPPVAKPGPRIFIFRSEAN
jgi:outer membrane biosynthesis protein TonB